MAAKRTGRRPGTSATRAAILAAARRQFADVGYERTTLRGVAAEAGVDPALVVHFFGSALGVEDPPRAALVGAQLVGTIALAIAPTLQRYLVEEIS